MCEVSWDDDSLSAYDYRWIDRARKPFECRCCLRTVLRGQRYFYEWGIFDGSTFNGRLCERCGNASQEFMLRHHGGWLTDYLREGLDDCIAEEPTSAEWLGQFYPIALRADPWDTEGPKLPRIDWEAAKQ